MNIPALAVTFIVSSLQVTLQIFSSWCNFSLLCTSVFPLCTKIFMKFYIAGNVILKSTESTLVSRRRETKSTQTYPSITSGYHSRSIARHEAFMRSLHVVAIGTLSSSLVLLVRALNVMFNTTRVRASFNVDSSRQAFKL